MQAGVVALYCGVVRVKTLEGKVVLCHFVEVQCHRCCCRRGARVTSVREAVARNTGAAWVGEVEQICTNPLCLSRVGKFWNDDRDKRTVLCS